MKRLFYKVYLHATHNFYGDERRALIPVFIPKTKQSLTMDQQIEIGTRTLEAEGYYNISYCSTIEAKLIIAE